MYLSDNGMIIINDKLPIKIFLIQNLISKQWCLFTFKFKTPARHTIGITLTIEFAQHIGLEEIFAKL